MSFIRKSLLSIRFRSFFCLVLLLYGVFFKGVAYSLEELRQKIEVSKIYKKLNVRGRNLYSLKTLALFYQQTGFQGVWINNQNALDELLAAIIGAKKEGLNPSDYHLHALNEIISDKDKEKVKVDLELLATDAFLTLGSHFIGGKVNPELIDSEWQAQNKEIDLSTLLKKAIENSDIQNSLLNLLPVSNNYKKLKEIYIKYDKLPDWNLLSFKEKIYLNFESPKIIDLRKRLAFIELLPNTLSPIFDEELKLAIKVFQERHGLDVDGEVGPKTLSALNITRQDRLKQLRLNLERLRWLKRDFGNKHIFVNIAGFYLDAVEGEKTKINMKVIAGMPYRRTPVFSDLMTYIVLNPSWHVPPSIAVKDKLPLIRKNVSYLQQQKIIVYSIKSAKEIDPLTVNWSTVSEKNLSYRFVQSPGVGNALGKVKFMFPNKFNVYLHDTSAPELFFNSERSFSSGCIRLEKPLELTTFVLENNNEWNIDKINLAIENGKEQTVKLQASLPVHITYLTAWVDNSGKINFRKDIYSRDDKLHKALNENPIN